jgi:hypothetical protein
MSQEKAYELCVKGMNEPVTVVWSGKGEALLADTVPDYKTRLDYLKEYNKLNSHYAPTEPPPKEGDKHVHYHFNSEEAQKKSAERLFNEIQEQIGKQ